MDEIASATQSGHNVTEGRNVIPSERRPAQGRDIFFAAVQMSRMPMVLSDPHQPDCPIVFCNQAFEQLCGYSQAEIIGRNCRFLQGENTDRKAVADIREALAASRDVHQEIFNYRKDGSGFWNALFISPVIDTDGTLVYFFGSQLDVTKRREAEAVLHQSERMDTLGGLASGLAHEFNNLLTIILSSLELALDEKDEARRRSTLQRAMWGGQRAARLTDQMLSFTRRQLHDNRVVDLGRAVGNMDAILGQMAGPALKLEVDLGAGLLSVKLDAGRLEMALLNLVRNAADASSDGGAIRVVTGLCTLGQQEAACVSVIDQGSGMTPEVLAHATEPFFTTKPIGKGTGFGLSMVAGFVGQSEGRLDLTSVPGNGTTVRMAFPLTKSAEEGPAR